MNNKTTGNPNFNDDIKPTLPTNINSNSSSFNRWTDLHFVSGS